MTALKFFKGALPQGLTLEAGMIWFDTTNNVIKVCNSDKAWEEYCGNIQVKDVKFENNVLTITPREGNATTLDFSDVASARQTMAVFTELQASITALQTADSNTNDRIDALTEGMPDGQKTIVSYVAAEIEKVDTESAAAVVQGKLDAEVTRATQKEAELAQAIEDAEAYTDEVAGKYAAEGVEASGLRKEIAERDAQTLADAKEYVDEVVGSYAEGETPATGLRSEIAGVDAKVDALDGRVADVETAITGEGGLDSRLDVLEGYFDGNTEGGVAGIVDAKINALDADVTSAEGTKVRVQVVETDGKITGVTVTEDFSAITDAIDDEAERAAEEEGKLADAIVAEKARIDTLIGITADSEGDKGMSVRAIAIEEVAKIVNETDNDSIDTLKEIAAWIAAHPKDAAEYNARITANEQAIEQINTTIEENEETVAAALTDLDTRVDALEAKNATIDSALQQADIVTGSTNGTISVKGSEVAVAGLQDAAYVTVDSLNTTAQGYATTAKNEAVATVVGDATKDTKDSQTIEGVKKYVDDKVAGKNVEAAGDDYVSATATGNKVTVATNMTAIREAVLTWESFN